MDVDHGRFARFRRLFLVLLVAVVVVQQFPEMPRNYYDALRLLLYAGFGLLALLSLVRVAIPPLPAMLRSARLAIVVTLTFGLVASTAESLTPIIELAVAMSMVWISWMNPLSERALRRGLIALGVLLSAVAVAVISDAGGIVISVHYVVAHKNQVGPLLGSAALCGLAIIGSLLSEHKRNWWLIGLTMLNVSIAVVGLVVSRNRTGLLAFIAVAFLALVVNFKQRPRARVAIVGFGLGLFTAVLAFPALLGGAAAIVWDSLTLSRDLTDVESVSSGRFGGYEEALSFLRNNWAFGMLAEERILAQIPHNYILHKLSLYGVVGGATILLFYGRLWVWAVRAQQNPHRGPEVCSWNHVGRLLLFVLFVSLLEYSYPFGPGVSGVLVWIMLGQAMARAGSVAPSIGPKEVGQPCRQ